MHSCERPALGVGFVGGTRGLAWPSPPAWAVFSKEAYPASVHTPGPQEWPGEVTGVPGNTWIVGGCPHVCASKALVAPGGAGTEGRERASCGSAATPPAPAMSWWISGGQNATCEPGFQTAVKLYLSREDSKHISFTNLLA